MAGAGDTISGQKTWDPDLSDGFDSGWVDVQLVAGVQDDSSPVTWKVTGGSGQLSYEEARFNYISQITISAAVGGQNCRMSWRSVSVEFYRHGVLAQTVTPDGPVADTISSSVNNASISVLPEASDNDKVIVLAQVRLESTSQVLPSPGGISGVLSVSAS